MNINAPTPAQIPQLKALWQQAFGDTDEFIDGFFRTGFSPERCRCITLEGQIVAALYWFDTEENFAYLYAVATEESHRGKGLCRNLMESTHKHLTEMGYAGAVLVPAEPGLWGYYGKLGYTPFGSSCTFSADSGNATVLEEISLPQYAKLRQTYLPANALTESAAMAYYSTWGKFYRNQDCLFAAAVHNDTLYIQEYFGNPDAAPGIVAALGCTQGNFRTPGGDDPCGMYLLLKAATPPAYLGFPLD